MPYSDPTDYGKVGKVIVVTVAVLLVVFVIAMLIASPDFSGI